MPPPDLVTIGEHSYNRPTVPWHVGDTGKVRIGRYSSMPTSVTILVGGEHRPDWVSTYPLRIRFDLPGAYRDGAPMSRGDVEIGNDVWIGYDALILSGVRIGDGAVVAAGSVVVHDVAAFSIAAGVPAKHVKWRFTEEQRAALARIKWWDWPDEKVAAAADLLSSPDIDAFIRAHDVRSQDTAD